LLISKEVEVKLHSTNIRYYEEKGYPIPRKKDKHGRFLVPRGSTIIVKIKDLQLKSNVDIDIECDYCGIKFKRRYADHTFIHNKDNNIDNDACEDCAILKFKEVYFLKHGVKNPFCQNEVRQKIANTFSKNNSVSTSKQQIYLHNLLGGELNYANDTPVLDIAYPDEKIYLEYNGGGHNLKVKLGIETEEEFKNKELRRYHYLKDKGWKAIFIDSNEDFLPKDNMIIDIIKIAKDYLSKDNKWIKFKIDENKVIYGSKLEEIFDYGQLRKIKDKDIEIVS